MIKELKAELEVFHREAKKEERTWISNVKAERVKTESNKVRTIELEAQMFEAERELGMCKHTGRPTSGTVSIRFGTYNIRNRRNSGLEAALQGGS